MRGDRVEGEEDEVSLRALAERLGMECYEELSGYFVDKELYQKIPYAFVKKNCLIPVEERGEAVVVAVGDPLNLDAIEELKHRLDRPITALYAPKSAILSHIQECYHQEKGAASQMIAEMKPRIDDSRGGEDLEVYDLLDRSTDQAPIIKLLNLILVEAIQQGASDLHFEPGEEGLRVRYRVDGVLQNRHSPPPEYQSQLLTRIKVMAKLDIAERRRPQDGRIKLRMGNRDVDFRVSTVPVVGGERIVLRILDKGNMALGLESIGMPSAILKRFKELTHLPEGIILVTGPTGSGKTTTLYSAVSEMPEGKLNIMTIEDPVEYKLKGIAQIAVQSKIGLDFSAGLRTILRQDPDIVLVGEVRDVETANIAIQASLTGHLVLSTLHTNDAPSAITRLVDMGVEPYLISSTLVGVLAQRLLRAICPECRGSYVPADEELKNIGVSRERLQEEVIYRGAGCSACFESGYRGRLGIYELMTISRSMQTQIVKSPNAVELRQIARKEGMKSLLESGADLVLEGKTTVEELLRVTRGTDEG